MTEPVVLTVDELEKRLALMSSQLPAAMLVAMRGAVAYAVRYAVLRQLSGQKLRRRTGTLQRDVEHSPSEAPPRIESASSVVGTIGTSLGYGKAHEQGFHELVAVRSHRRRRLGRILAVDIRTRAASRRARITKAQKALERSATIFVSGHAMRMNIQARWYLRDSAKAANPELRDGALRSLEFLARTGRLPKLSDIQAAGGARA